VWQARIHKWLASTSGYYVCQQVNEEAGHAKQMQKGAVLVIKALGIRVADQDASRLVLLLCVEGC